MGADRGATAAGPPPERTACGERAFRVALPGAAGRSRPALRCVPPADPGHPAVDLDLDLTGVKVLTVTVGPGSYLFDGDHLALGGARVTK